MRLPDWNGAGTPAGWCSRQNWRAGSSSGRPCPVRGRRERQEQPVSASVAALSAPWRRSSDVPLQCPPHVLYLLLWLLSDGPPVPLSSLLFSMQLHFLSTLIHFRNYSSYILMRPSPISLTYFIHSPHFCSHLELYCPIYIKARCGYIWLFTFKFHFITIN